jgi:hypothetical protein
VDPHRRSRSGLFVALTVAGLLLVLGGTATMVGVSTRRDEKPAARVSSATGSSSAPAAPFSTGVNEPLEIVLPRSIDGYRKVGGPGPAQTAKGLRRLIGIGRSADVASTAKIATYERNGNPKRSLVFIGLSALGGPAIAEELRTHSPAEEVAATFTSLQMSGAIEFPAGPLGGVLRCGFRPIDGFTSGGGVPGTCVWADRWTIGAILAPPGTSLEMLAGLTLGARDTAER